MFDSILQFDIIFVRKPIYVPQNVFNLFSGLISFPSKEPISPFFMSFFHLLLFEFPGARCNQNRVVFFFHLRPFSELLLFFLYAESVKIEVKFAESLVLVPLLGDFRVGISLELVLYLHVARISLAQIWNRLFFLVLEQKVVKRFYILMYNCFSRIVFFKNGQIMGDRIQRLLRKIAETFRFLDKINNSIWNILLHTVPQKGHILFGKNENVAMLLGHDPIMLLCGPSVCYFGQSNDISGVKNSLQAGQGYIFFMRK